MQHMRKDVESRWGLELSFISRCLLYLAAAIGPDSHTADRCPSWAMCSLCAACRGPRSNLLHGALTEPSQEKKKRAQSGRPCCVSIVTSARCSLAQSQMRITMNYVTGSPSSAVVPFGAARWQWVKILDRGTRSQALSTVSSEAITSGCGPPLSFSDFVVPCPRCPRQGSRLQMTTATVAFVGRAVGTCSTPSIAVSLDLAQAYRNKLNLS